MNVDEICSVPDLSFAQSFEELVQQLDQWQENQIAQIRSIYSRELVQLHSYYTKALKDFEHAKIIVMDDFCRLVDECTSFSIDELDLYLKQILKNVEKLQNKIPITFSDSSYWPSVKFSYQPILLSEWIDPYKLYFSQSTVHASTYLTYKDQMKYGKWIWDRRPDEHPKSSALTVANIDGQLVSFDNRRLLAAQELNIKRVPIVRVNLDEQRPSTSITWRKSFENRLKQSKLSSQGTSVQPSLKY